MNLHIRGILGCVVLLSSQVSIRAQTPFVLKDLLPAKVENVCAVEAGPIESVDVKIGDQVKEKQMLVKQEHLRQLHTYTLAKLRAENRAGIEYAEGELQYKQAAFTEMQARNRRRQVSDAMLAQSAADVKIATAKLGQAKLTAEIAKLEMELAEKMLERRFIRSPMDGVVVGIMRAGGEKANEGELLVIVADLSVVVAEIPVSKESAASLKSGDTMPVKMQGGGLQRVGQIQSIRPAPNGAKGEQIVKIAFTNISPHIALQKQICEVLLPEYIKTVALPKVASNAPAPKK